MWKYFVYLKIQIIYKRPFFWHNKEHSEKLNGSIWYICQQLNILSIVGYIADFKLELLLSLQSHNYLSEICLRGTILKHLPNIQNYFNFLHYFFYFQWLSSANNTRIVHERNSNQKIYFDITIANRISV